MPIKGEQRLMSKTVNDNKVLENASHSNYQEWKFT